MALTLVFFKNTTTINEENVMNKSELVASIAQQADISKADAGRALDSLMQTTQDALAKGDDIVLVGFGTFTVSERNARKGRNPQTGEEIQIPASKLPTFKAGKALKEAVNK
ncbi:HU family DNA-binding protein [Algicola sagamiensis]|uniref:HU family DNA-binding protein n=1 Tax=Algicola sagamiensis TaxID=163869 RepID=UPI00247FB894|nr:HU family DNA-binding protein [Algicola sagamiensis]